MTLELYIEELLYDYECVTVPGFGAFLTRSYNFKINRISGEFVPSRKEIAFNSLLKSNDGVLSNYLAKKQKISYEKALRQIEKEVKEWKKKLKTQALFIGNLGKLSLNQNKKIQFDPYGKINFDSSSYGLISFYRTPVSSFNYAKKERLNFTPGKTKKVLPFIKNYFRYAAIGLIGLIIGSSSYYFSNVYLTNQRIINQQIAQKEIEKNVQSATFDLGKLNSFILSVDVIQKNKIPETKTTYYSIIAGTFRNKSYAMRKIENLKTEGYNAEIAKVNPKGMYRVAYGRFKSKSEAIKLLYLLKNTLKKDAWYLIER